MIVYVRATFDEDVGPVTFFLDILSLPSTTADGIEMSLLQCLNANAMVSVMTVCRCRFGVSNVRFQNWTVMSAKFVILFRPSL